MQQNQALAVTGEVGAHERLLEKVAVLCSRSRSKVAAVSDSIAKQLLAGAVMQPGREQKAGVCRYGAIWVQYWAGVYYAECCQYGNKVPAPVSEANVAVIDKQYPDVCHIVKPNGEMVKGNDKALQPLKVFGLKNAIEYCQQQGWDYIIN